MAEFDLIDKYFAPLSGKGAEGLRDDGVVLDIPEGWQLAMSSDTSNRGDHFVEEMPPADVARKCLRSNLSDLASMGADPFVYQLNLALPLDLDREAWLSEFAKGLAGDQEEFGITLSGGDTTGMMAGGLSVSITALGLVPEGQAVRRFNGKVGDLVVVTGPLGDACLNRLRIPYPPSRISPLIRQYARAGVDISDGLPADLGHICDTSGVGARVDLSKIPFSPEVKAAVAGGEKSWQDIFIWGEDYELALTVAPENVEAFKTEAARQGVELSVIGEITQGEGLEIIDGQGAPLVFKQTGWSHFQDD